MDFNIYYINFPKTYEIRMIMDNTILTDSKIESDVSESDVAEVNTSLKAKLACFFSADIGAGLKLSSVDSQKVIETFEVKTTKAIILRDVIQKCQVVQKLEDASVGQLLRISGVKLNLVNNEELRSVKLLSTGAFKGASIMQFEGVDLNNAINSALKDYAYKIKGIIKGEAHPSVLVKIPMTFENEFESLYGVDDIFIGEMTLVGIYKGKIKMESLQNTFDFLQKLGEQSNDSVVADEISNSQTANKSSSLSFATEKDGNEYHFLDLLAIVQEINLQKEKK